MPIKILKCVYNYLFYLQCSEWFSDEKISLPPFEIKKTDTCISSKGVRKHVLKVFNTEVIRHSKFILLGLFLLYIINVT